MRTAFYIVAVVIVLDRLQSEPGWRPDWAAVAASFLLVGVLHGVTQ